jgi:hypothetical protein
VCLSPPRDVIKDLLSLQIPQNGYIVCADVKSLYPSIPIEYGIQAVGYMLRVFQFYSADEISFLIELLNWVLTNNYLEYNNQIYLQISGTAMGTPVAVTYSNLVLCYL